MYRNKYNIEREGWMDRGIEGGRERERERVEERERMGSNINKI